MERSLTVLLPVQDAQATLTETVEEILDLAAELTDRFELLIIDDGSADATNEIAHELTRHYPQVRSLRHATPQGHDAAVRTGLCKARAKWCSYATKNTAPWKNSRKPVGRSVPIIWAG